MHHLDVQKHEQDERDTLYEAYEYGLALNAMRSRFRDAVMDAIIEFTDNFAGRTYEMSFQELPDATKDHPDCLLRKLMVLYFVFNWSHGDWRMPPAGLKQVEGGKLLEMAKAVKQEICHGPPSH